MKKRIDQFVEVEIARQLKEGSNAVLTGKESIIGSYLIFGYTVSEIAKRLYRSKNTIKIHIRKMRHKFKCETQTRLGAVLQSFIKNSPEGYRRDDANEPE